MSKAQIDVSVIIVSWNTHEFLAACLQSLYDTVRAVDFEIFVVDNASSDDSAGMVKRRFPQVRLIQNTDNVGFVRANNQAIACSRGRYVLLLNSDTRVLPDCLEQMMRFMDEHVSVALAGARLLNPDGTFQASHARFPTVLQEFLMLSGLGREFLRPTYPGFGPEVHRGPQVVEYVQGACLFARRQAIEEIGGLDEGIFMYSEEVDWCYRFVKAGWAVCYLPHVAIVHYGGQSTRQRRGRMEAELYRSRVYFFRKHYGRFPAYFLKILIYSFTLPKIAIHGFLRFLTAGKRGRTVTNLKDLHMALSSRPLD